MTARATEVEGTWVGHWETWATATPSKQSHVKSPALRALTYVSQLSQMVRRWLPHL